MSIGIIGSCLVLIILIIAVIFALKKTTDKKSVDKFINDLGENILSIVLETINDIDPSNFNNFDEFNSVVITNVYNAVWDFVSYTAKEELAEDSITKTVFKLIDKTKVIEFLDRLFYSQHINQTIQDTYGRYTIQKMIEDEEDNELQKEYSDQTLYIEDIDEFELPPAKEKEIPPEELAKIIPPVEDDDEILDLEDDSVELIVDKTEIVKSVDKNGKELYYEVNEDGKKSRISKAAALEKLGELQ